MFGTKRNASKVKVLKSCIDWLERTRKRLVVGLRFIVLVLTVFRRTASTKWMLIMSMVVTSNLIRKHWKGGSGVLSELMAV